MMACRNYTTPYFLRMVLIFVGPSFCHPTNQNECRSVLRIVTMSISDAFDMALATRRYTCSLYRTSAKTINETHHHKDILGGFYNHLNSLFLIHKRQNKSRNDRRAYLVKDGQVQASQKSVIS